MPKLSKALRARLQHALDAAERTYAYLHDPSLVVAHLAPQPRTSLDYTHTDGTALQVMAKHSSHIVGIEDTISTLRRLLAKESQGVEG